MNRTDSLKLEGLYVFYSFITSQLHALKRGGSLSVQDAPKVVRQNTFDQLPIPTIPVATPLVPSVPNPIITFLPSQSAPSLPTSSQPKKDGKTHRILTAKIGGVNYMGEMCGISRSVTCRKKKDKRDPHKWTPEEDELLKAAVNEFGEKQWKDIASRIPGRNHVQCLQRWKKVLKPGLKKGHWTEEEDNLLRFYKSKCCNWAEIAEKIPGRTAKQCRERWCNHINPEIRKGSVCLNGLMIREWTAEEDRLILSLQKEWGNRWSSIAQVPLLT